MKKKRELSGLGVLKERVIRLYNSSYISRRLLLLLDSLVGVVSGVVALLLLRYLLWSPEWRVAPVGWLLLCVVSFGSTWVSSVAFKTYRQLLRFQTSTLGLRVLSMVFLNFVLFVTSFYILSNLLQLPSREVKRVVVLSIFYLATFTILFLGWRTVLIHLAHYLRRSMEPRPEAMVHRQRVLIYGFSEESVEISKLLEQNAYYQVKGFCSKDKSFGNALLAGHATYTLPNREAMYEVSLKQNIDGIIFPSRREFLKERESFIFGCEAVGLRTYLMPHISETTPTRVARESVQRIRIEDLLDRDIINHEEKPVARMYQGKVVMVTGAAGSIGSELVVQIAALGVKQLVLLDMAETPVHDLRLRLEHKFPTLNFVPIVGDVRDKARVEEVITTYRPEIVLHAAAYKHVPLMEEHPCEAIRTNLTGTRHVADACVKCGVERTVLVSTDKAVNPTNVMGATKRACEMYVQSLGEAIRRGEVEGHTLFITTRFGNVLGSQGSVIHLFREQIAKGGPVTVTHPEIVRYFMSIPEACSLILEASALAENTRIFVFDMGEEHKIVDLAERMIRLAGMEPYEDIDITFTGLRPGEKLYEEKLASEENTIQTDIPKIHIARVRSQHFAHVQHLFGEAERLAHQLERTESVRALKALVPEYRSALNSEFAPLDPSPTA